MNMRFAPLALLIFALCGIAGFVAAPARAQAAATPAISPAARARADSGRPPYTEADVHFVSGMIGHHAQAIVMAGWAPTHGASASLRALCERIVVGQGDEIVIMQGWLRDRHQEVPDPAATLQMMMQPNMSSMMMPGMLTSAQMAELDRARGTDFDRLFLTYMIQHHRGALSMVDELLGSNGAANDDAVYKMASDISADQTTEINRMTLMLNALPTGGR
jgi:uncharacterized protein (DUF305 family)